MKKFLFILFITVGCSSQNPDVRMSLSLAGEWKFVIDSLDQGVAEEWYNKVFEETVTLPGSMAENGKGNDVSLKTKWTGDIIDKSFFTEKKYKRYRQPGNFKVPFWLQPVKYYKGAAWYQKEFELPADCIGKHTILFLERPHWESTVFVNGQRAGTENSLAVAHHYDITDLIIKGKNSVSIRIDNRIIIPVGVNSHSVSDHTQSNWNGIAGDISIRSKSSVFIDDIKIFPDIRGKGAKLVLSVRNGSGSEFNGDLVIGCESYNTEKPQKLKMKKAAVAVQPGSVEIVMEYPMGANVKFWSEFSPVIYRLTAYLKDSDGGTADIFSGDFGMREFKFILHACLRE